MSNKKAPRGLIYVLTSPDGLQYVGQTAGPMWQRLSRHVRDVKRGSNRPICAAIREHGIGSFLVTIIAQGVDDQSTRTKIEAENIESLSTIWPKGLNTLRCHASAEHLHTPLSRTKAEIGKALFHKNNPEKSAAMIARARQKFNPEQARQLCLSRNSDPDFKKVAKAALEKRLSEPAYRKKLKNLGQDRAKVKDSEIESILKRLASGETKVSVGKTYGVTPQCIGLLLKRNKLK